MIRGGGAVLARSYMVLVLLAALLVGSPPHVWITLVALILQSLALYRRLSPPHDLVLTLVTLLLVPQALDPLLGPPSVLLILPAYPLLDQEFLAMAPVLAPPDFRTGRWTSLLLSSVTLGLLSLGLLGVFLGSMVLSAGAGTLFALVLGRMGYVLLRTRETTVQFEGSRLRILAGGSARTALQLNSTCPFALRIGLSSPYPWLQLSPEALVIPPHSSATAIAVVTPSLAGPTRPAFQVTSLDAWGLLWKGEVLMPLELHVVPKARYATWLARRYLEQTQTPLGVSAGSGAPRVRGVEFYGVREYQPGEQQRDLEWRHTLKFQELMVKDHREPQVGGVVLLVNLVAGDREEMDWLAFHLVTTALTAAREGAPVALAAYDQQKVVFATGKLPPREAVKYALGLSERLQVVEQHQRLLALPNLPRLRRAEQALAPDAMNGHSVSLGQLLRFEVKALELVAREHPLTLALQSILRWNPPPTTVTVISRWNHDAEALAVALPRLRRQKYRVLDVRAETPK